MTPEQAVAIASKTSYSKHDMAIALLEAYRDGWSEGYRDCDKTLAVYQRRKPALPTPQPSKGDTNET